MLAQFEDLDYCVQLTGHNINKQKTEHKIVAESCILPDQGEYFLPYAILILNHRYAMSMLL